MFQRFHEMKERNEAGFTLIELLVVILIIAILAAIAIPVFLRQREKGWRSQIQSSLKNAATAQESYSTENNGTYTDDPALLTAEGFRGSAAVALDLTPTTDGATVYCMEAEHDALPGEIWSYDSNVGEPVEATC